MTISAYCVEADLNNHYGQQSIQRWADLDNSGNTTVISTRISWAIDLATEYINSRMVNNYYDVPFSSVPQLVVDMTAMLAGIYLHDGRAVVSMEDMRDSVKFHRKHFDKLLKQILSGQITLINPSTQEPLTLLIDNRAPFAVSQTTTSSLYNTETPHRLIYGDEE